LTLFVSDLHIGRGTEAQSRAAQTDFLDLLEAHRAELEGGALVLVGDVFDQYIEYKHVVPKPAVRVLAALSALAEAGCAVTYVVGNRDPWHVDFLEHDLGVTLIRGATAEGLPGGRTYIVHGDGYVPAERISNRLRPLLRSPLLARLYRMALPGDSGFAFARWFAHRFGTDGAPQEWINDALRAAAGRILASDEIDVVVMGHGHRAELTTMNGGVYLNPGYWFKDRTFGRMDADGPSLLRWRAGRVEAVKPEAAALA
jgi:UDP-2,3-diacylglucosamine hydrolase